MVHLGGGMIMSCMLRVADPVGVTLGGVPSVLVLLHQGVVYLGTHGAGRVLLGPHSRLQNDVLLLQRLLLYHVMSYCITLLL